MFSRVSVVVFSVGYQGKTSAEGFWARRRDSKKRGASARTGLLELSGRVSGSRVQDVSKGLGSFCGLVELIIEKNSKSATS